MQTKSCKAYRDLAWNTMSAHWLEGILIMLIIILCSSIGSGVAAYGGIINIPAISMLGTGASFVVAILLVEPLTLAFQQVLLGWVRKPESDKEDGVAELFRTTGRRYSDFVVTGVLMTLVIVAIGVVTLWIGAIIFGLAYSIVPFVLQDNPELSPKEALNKSRLMMRGHKGELFTLWFSFFGWWILGILTMGIGFLWIQPYWNTAIAHFYEDIKGE